MSGLTGKDGGATTLTTAQFANSSNFTDWDFDNTWIMKDGRPELRIFLTAEEIEELEEADNAANESQE